MPGLTSQTRVMCAAMLQCNALRQGHDLRGNPSSVARGIAAHKRHDSATRVARTNVKTTRACRRGKQALGALF